MPTIKDKDKTLIEITPRYKLERYLIAAAITALCFYGIELSEKQMVVFLGQTGIGSRILDYNQVESTISRCMLSELSHRLLGESLPTNGSLRFLDITLYDHDSIFYKRLRCAAIKYGYKVIDLQSIKKQTY